MLAGASAAVSLVWIAWVADLKGLYLDVFRAALREGTLRPAVDLPPVDLVSLETLFGALNSADDHEVLAAMDLLAEEGRARLIPALILYHPSQRVVLRALELFAARRAGRLPARGRAAAAPRGRRDPRGRPARPHARAARRGPPARRPGRTRAPSCARRRSAGRVAGGWDGEEARAAARGARSPTEAETSLALARAIVAQPSPAFEDVLLRLADGPSDADPRAGGAGHGRRAQPAVPARAARPARAGARCGRRRGRRSSPTGRRASPSSTRPSATAGMPVELRRHLPRTIALFDAARAAAALERHVLEEPSGAVRYRILRGMNRLAASPDVEFDPALLRRADRRDRGGGLPPRPLALGPGAGGARARGAGDARPRAPRPAAARQGGAGGGEALPAAGPAVPRRGLQGDLPRPARGGSPRPGQQPGAAREPPAAAAAGAGARRSWTRRPTRPGSPAPASCTCPAALGYEDVLGLILERGGESLRCVAAHHVGELGLVALRPRLERLRGSGASFFLARVVEHALAAFPPGLEGAARA